MDNNINPNILKHSSDIRCHECNGMFFRQDVMLRRVSKIAIASPEDMTIPIPVFICTNCHTPLKEQFDMILEDLTPPKQIIDVN